MIWIAAIYCTLVVRDTFIVSPPERWFTSHGENAVASWAYDFCLSYRSALTCW
jgi:hypothetical protein